MDINEYISSGAIESYVLGLSSVEEMRELELLSNKHPEVSQALGEVESALERVGLENAVPPPAGLKQIIMAALEAERNRKTILPVTDASTQAKAKVIPMVPTPKSVRWLQGAIAASIILLLGSSILNFYFYSQYKTYNGKYTELLTQNNTVLAKNNALEATYKMRQDTGMIQMDVKELQDNYAMFTSPSMVHVAMTTANPLKPGNIATVLWDSNTKDVYLMVNNLPKNADDQQYQLWALVDGKPIDAGMVDMTRPDGMLKMRNIPKAQAFAITLEKKGGSPTPNMAQLYVLGKV